MERRILLHSDVFMPETINGTQNLYDLVSKLQKHLGTHRLSEHLKQHIDDYDDRSHDYLGNVLEGCIMSCTGNPQRPFEVELTEIGTRGAKAWAVTKYCVRVPYSKDQDVAIVIRPGIDYAKMVYDVKRNVVVTAWLNHATDAHSTLDHSKYCSKENWERVN